MMTVLLLLSLLVSLFMLLAQWRALFGPEIDLYFTDISGEVRIPRPIKRLYMSITILFPIPLWILELVLEYFKIKPKGTGFWVWVTKKYYAFRKSNS